MSVYIQCREAATRLLEEPGLADPAHYGGIVGLFTELNVILLAARTAEDWEADRESHMRLAAREASQVMGGLFRTRKVVRFGPVEIPGIGEPDYMRVASKIIYAGVDGPTEVTTPNGVFPRLFVQDDPITKQGRRLGTNRDDLQPWAEQNILVAREPVVKSEVIDQRKIIRVEAELLATQLRLQRVEAELHRLRDHRALPLTPEQSVEQTAELLTSLCERIDRLEGGMEKTAA